MDFLPYSQEYMLMVSVMGGMFLGFIWDIYRLIRHYVKLSVTGTALGDIAYWIVSVYISIQLIYDISYGNIRFFILLGFIGGALLYFYGISNYILKALIFVVDYIVKLIRRFINFMIAPIRFLINKIKSILYPYKLKAIQAKEKAKRRYKFFKFRLKKISKNRKMLYNSRTQIKRRNKKRRKELKRFERNKRKSKNNRIEKKN